MIASMTMPKMNSITISTKLRKEMSMKRLAKGSADV